MRVFINNHPLLVSAILCAVFVLLGVFVFKWNMLIAQAAYYPRYHGVPQLATLPRSIDRSMARFFGVSLRYQMRFKNHYPKACKMPNDMPYGHPDYLKVWTRIFEDLHTRPYRLRLHRWLRRMSIDLNLNNPSSRIRYTNPFVDCGTCHANKHDHSHQHHEYSWFGIVAVSLVTILPPILELLCF